MLKTAEDSVCNDLLIGAHDALRGRKHVPRPEGWAAAFARLAARRNPVLVEHTLWKEALALEILLRQQPGL